MNYDEASHRALRSNILTWWERHGEEVTEIIRKNTYCPSDVTFSIGRPFIIHYYRIHLKNFKITQITQK
jgi:hypothetical protein